MNFDKKNFKVLVIDDETDLLESVAEQIEMFGYTVLKASNVENGIEYIPYCDGILADVNMPGKERLTHFLNSSVTKVPVIRFSAENQRGLVNFMLAKPFTPQKLYEALDQLRLFSNMKKAA